jgi:hypothetical protein
MEYAPTAMPGWRAAANQQNPRKDLRYLVRPALMEYFTAVFVFLTDVQL